ncbi:MAG: beta-N-acetylhexosaminidase [Acidimicrobiales bacterium]
MIDDLLPRPRAVVALGGTVRWRSPLTVSAPALFDGELDTFAHDLGRAVGWSVDRVTDGAALRVAWDASLAPGAYQLVVDDPSTIAASDGVGLAHALTTLRQLAPGAWWSARPAPVTSLALARVRVEDAPRFAWRGVHLDVARHFFDVDVVCRLIDLLAAHRLSHLHLHLNDDQGWRVALRAWPRLTEVGAWRASTPIGHAEDGRDDGVPYGGYYSEADVARLVAHAATRHVTLVPEVDLPGHAQAVLAAYPTFANVDEPLAVATRWGISPHVLAPSPAALDFVARVVGAVADLFPGSPVHVGGDECPTDEWARHAPDVMAAHGFTDPRQIQGLFSARATAAVRARGREVLTWDEALDAPLDPSTIIVAWRDVGRAVAAARRGYDVILAAQQRLYLDWANSADPREPVAITRAPRCTTWEDVYGVAVVPEELEASLAPRVRGAQAQLWSEYIVDRDHLDYMAFPRLAAFAEVVWGTAGSLAAFRPRLVSHLARLDAAGVAYRPLDAWGVS